MTPADIESALARHEQIAFQFSGGRDSTAALYLMRPFWGRMRFYHINPGFQFPELTRVVELVRADLAREGIKILDVESSVMATWHKLGTPSDLVPFDNTPFGQLLGGQKVRLTGRIECCGTTFMLPMHRRMVADGNTLLVRGQRDSEYARQPMRSGDTDGQFEVLYPIQDWTDAQVMAYLRDNDLPVGDFYERGFSHSPECMCCTAWWDEPRLAYLEESHPDHYADLVQRLGVVTAAINRQYEPLLRQIERTES